MRALVREVCEATQAALVAGSAETVIEGVAIDSREAGPGIAFVAFVGEQVDGNDFTDKAARAGAAAVVMTRQATPAELGAAAETGCALLRADGDDGEAFLQRLAAWWLAQLDAVVVGVTGSSGKTTTRNMITAVLSSELRTHTAKGNHNNLIGAPLTVLDCPADAQAIVVEMGMDGFGQIAALTRVAQPDVAVVTNVGVAHIGDLGSRDNIARAKSEIIEGMHAPTDGRRVAPRAILHGEDDYAVWMRDQVAAPRGIPVTFFGGKDTDGVYASDVVFDQEGQPRATVHLPGGRTTRVELAFVGEHNLIDALAAAAVGDALGISPEHIAQGLAAARPFKMHQQVLHAEAGFTLIDDSYNANPDSMRRAIDQLMTVGARRHIACLGDMGGLGPTEGLQHAAIGGYAAGKGVDELVCVGPLSRNTAEAANLMGVPRAGVTCVDTPEEAAANLRGRLGEGDAVLVIASHCTGLERTVAGIIEGQEVR